MNTYHLHAWVPNTEGFLKNRTLGQKWKIKETYFFPSHNNTTDLIQFPSKRGFVGSASILTKTIKWLSLAHPIMNFILPLLAAWMRMGTSWGSLGPNIPWGRIAVVKKLLHGSFALSTSCREKKITKSGEKGWEEKYSLITYSKIITKGGGHSPISLGRHWWKNYCPPLPLQMILPLFPSLLPLLFNEKKREKSIFIIEHLMN